MDFERVSLRIAFLQETNNQNVTINHILKLNRFRHLNGGGGDDEESTQNRNQKCVLSLIESLQISNLHWVEMSLMK
jgi:hypothetical protein